MKHVKQQDAEGLSNSFSSGFIRRDLGFGRTVSVSVFFGFFECIVWMDYV